MPIDVKDQDKPESPAEWDEVAAYIKAEREMRKSRRRDQEEIWKEIDRQLRMEPLPREVKSGEAKDWYPELETPLQFNTLEVIAADARRLLFPRNTDWFRPTSNIDDDYIRKFEQRRTVTPLVQGSIIPEKLDQETADTLVKVAIDHFHKLYDFRGKVDLFLAENIKYGTAVCRIRPVKLTHFTHDYRGVGSKSITGPAIIPCPIWDTYLDDRDTHMAHEGTVLGPSIIRGGVWQFLPDMLKAAEAGGPEEGWLVDNVRKLEAKSGKDHRRGQVEKVEFEGDLIIPRKNTSGFLFYPNVTVTIAMGTSTEVVRFRRNPLPFRSYVTGHYMREDLATPYGTSPLMKGQPIAEAAAMALNDLMAVGALNAQPPVAFDKYDAKLLGQGGPGLYPRAVIEAQNPEKVLPLQIGEPAALLQTYLALIQQYENLTGVNDPRRGAQSKSHTTATAIDIESTKGMSRTDDFVVGLQKGPITTMLYMEYEIIKSNMRKPVPVAVNLNGIDGWVTLSADDLPDEVEFSVSGAVGVLEEKERHQNFLAAVQTAVQLQQASMQAGMPFAIDFQAMAIEEMKRAGVNNAAKFITSVAAVPGGAAGAAALPGIASGTPPAVSPQVQATQARQ
jgi:hypothetical protein